MHCTQLVFRIPGRREKDAILDHPRRLPLPAALWTSGVAQVCLNLTQPPLLQVFQLIWRVQQVQHGDYKMSTSQPGEMLRCEMLRCIHVASLCFLSAATVLLTHITDTRGHHGAVVPFE